MTEKELLAVACEQFLGKNVHDIKNVVLQTLEGHLRSILGVRSGGVCISLGPVDGPPHSCFCPLPRQRKQVSAPGWSKAHF